MQTCVIHLLSTDKLKTKRQQRFIFLVIRQPITDVICIFALCRIWYIILTPQNTFRLPDILKFLFLFHNSSGLKEKYIILATSFHFLSFSYTEKEIPCSPQGGRSVYPPSQPPLKFCYFPPNWILWILYTRHRVLSHKHFLVS